MLEGVDADHRKRTGQKTPAWQFILLFILTVGLVIALVLTPQTPRSLLILSITLPLVLFSYFGWSRGLPWEKLPNIPTAIYFLYCSAVLWYIRPTYCYLYALTPLFLALFYCWRALRQWRISRSVAPASD